MIKYLRQPENVRFMEPQDADFHTCYLVYVQTEGSDSRNVVFTPGNRVVGEGASRRKESFLCSFAFATGLEFELERYLRWIDNTMLRDKYGAKTGELFVHKTTAREALNILTEAINTIPEDEYVRSQILLSPSECYDYGVWHQFTEPYTKTESLIF